MDEGFVIMATPNRTPMPVPTPGITPSGTPGHGYTPAIQPDEEIDWNKVDTAVDYFASLDIVEMASLIVNKALTKGPKDIYNEAGTVRFQLSKAKQMYRDLAQTICAESLLVKQEQIERLERVNAKKRWVSNAK